MKGILQIALTISLSLLSTMAFSQINIIANGDVGVGLLNPTSSLDVADDAKIRGNILEVGRDVELGATAQLKVGFGRSDDGFSAFDLVGDQSLNPGFGFRFQRTTNGQTNMLHKGDKPFLVRLDDPGSYFQIRIQNQPTFVMETGGDVGIGITNPTEKLDVAGNVKANGTILTSDMRLKTDVTSFDKGLDALMTLNPVRFKYTGQGGTSSEGHHVGIFAQDLQKVAPELVGTFNHNDGDGAQEYLHVDDTGIKYLLVNAIQEQQAQIKVKDQEIKELNDRITALEAMVKKIMD